MRSKRRRKCWGVVIMSEKDQIQALALENPTVRTGLALHANGSLTYVQALEQMVIAMAAQHAAVSADLLAIRIRGLPPTIIVTSQEQADQIRARYASGEPLSGSKS